MDNVSVKLTPGFAQTTIKEQPYVSDWAMDFRLPHSDTMYEVSVLTRGRGDSLGGLYALNYWREGDPNTLLLMRKSGTVKGEWQEGPISREDAQTIKILLGDIKDDKQRVLDNYRKDLPKDFRDSVVDFLEPRIVIGAEMLDEYGTARLGDIDNKLREEREGREEPPMPLT